MRFLCHVEIPRRDKFYGGLEEIGLLYVGSVFYWLYEYGLDVLLGGKCRVKYTYR